MNDFQNRGELRDRVLFYPVAIVGGLFCLTIFMIIAATFGNPQAPFNQWLNKNAMPLMLWETLLLVTVAIGAMAADRVRTLRRLAAERKTWVKICGITTVEDALAVSEHRPDAIGLNFYAKSKRCVSLDMAKRIVRTIPSWIEPVGLFVNHTAEEIQQTCAACGIRTIQLHGDETPEFVASLKQYRIIKAFRVNDQNISTVRDEIEKLQALNCKLVGCLVDAKVDGEYGGTGHSAPWDLLQRHWDFERWPRLILAGGLHPANVADAIHTVQPWGVDVASGVEASPGRQDAGKVQQFIRNARISK